MAWRRLVPSSPHSARQWQPSPLSSWSNRLARRINPCVGSFQERIPIAPSAAGHQPRPLANWDHCPAAHWIIGVGDFEPAGAALRGPVRVPTRPSFPIRKTDLKTVATPIDFAAFSDTADQRIVQPTTAEFAHEASWRLPAVSPPTDRPPRTSAASWKPRPLAPSGRSSGSMRTPASAAPKGATSAQANHDRKRDEVRNSHPDEVSR
jgi:hypothetical protein